MPDHRYRHLVAQIDNGVLVLTIATPKLQGDVLAEELRVELLDVVAQTDIQKVVLNLEHMSYLSSTGFRPFLKLRQCLNDKGGRLVLCNLTGAVEEAFRITRLISSSRSTAAPFEVQPDVQAAVASLQETPANPAPSRS